MEVVPKWRAVALDFLERGGWSAGQVFVATLLAGGVGTVGAVASLPWREAITLAVSAFVSSVVLTAVQYLSKQTNLAFWPDLIVRLAKTFLSALSASMVAGVFNVTTFDWENAFGVAFLATLASFGKGLLAREPASPNGQVPPDASPSTLPTGTYREAVDHGPPPPTIAATDPPASGDQAGSVPDR
ncbi:holin [Actinoplanes sp. DH11]|uniref:holin n=1 Tax=Actinoplanes sp. DH11 TaxID=2857011 RepID=UPI001E4FC332|nr:holin [Actinoplanes sp. DH11]